jgi:hypothetical protein
MTIAADVHCGNGRAVRNILEGATRKQALRLAKGMSSSVSSRTDQLRNLKAEDFGDLNAGEDQ